MGTLLLGVIFFACRSSLASDAALAERKAIASRFAERSREAAASAVMGRQGAGRAPAVFYKAGDHWRVQVWPSDTSMARKTSRPDQRHAGAASLRVYRFTVLEVRDESARLSVERADGSSSKPAVVWIDRQRHVRAIEHLLGEEGLDLFPINVPAPRSGADPHHYVSEDALGRKISVLWQEGQPWPESVSGAPGKAVLMREGQ